MFHPPFPWYPPAEVEDCDKPPLFQPPLPPYPPADPPPVVARREDALPMFLANGSLIMLFIPFLTVSTNEDPDDDWEAALGL